MIFLNNSAYKIKTKVGTILNIHFWQINITTDVSVFIMYTIAGFSQLTIPISLVGIILLFRLEVYIYIYKNDSGYLEVFIYFFRTFHKYIVLCIV